jgi:hypothetical protein
MDAKCTIGIEEDLFSSLTVMITNISAWGDSTVCTVTSKYGYLRGMWSQNDLVHCKTYTAEILCLVITLMGIRKAYQCKMHAII